MKHLNMESAVKRYNNLMNDLGLEFLTIGTNFSENTDGWNIRDMVAECDYQLGTYYENGHSCNELRYSDDEYERKRWWSETGKLRRFIEAYKPFIKDVVCEEGHCSKFDN